MVLLGIEALEAGGRLRIRETNRPISLIDTIFRIVAIDSASALEHFARSASGARTSGHERRKPPTAIPGSVSHQGNLRAVGADLAPGVVVKIRRAADRQSTASLAPPHKIRGNNFVGQRFFHETLLPANFLVKTGLVKTDP
jgi:hypothetical protein